MTTERPSSGEDPESERTRRRFEHILPELIKRVVESGFEKLADGYERISESPDNVRDFVRELRLPKEVLAALMSQVDETKNGLYRVVAREVRDFLDHTNLGDELARVLTTLSFEVKMEVRFIPNDARTGTKPNVRSRMRWKRAKSGEPPSPSPAPPPPSHEPEETP